MPGTVCIQSWCSVLVVSTNDLTVAAKQDIVAFVPREIIVACSANQFVIRGTAAQDVIAKPAEQQRLATAIHQQGIVTRRTCHQIRMITPQHHWCEHTCSDSDAVITISRNALNALDPIVLKRNAEGANRDPLAARRIGIATQVRDAEYLITIHRVHGQSFRCSRSDVEHQGPVSRHFCENNDPDILDIANTSGRHKRNRIRANRQIDLLEVQGSVPNEIGFDEIQSVRRAFAPAVDQPGNVSVPDELEGIVTCTPCKILERREKQAVIQITLVGRRDAPVVDRVASDHLIVGADTARHVLNVVLSMVNTVAIAGHRHAAQLHYEVCRHGRKIKRVIPLVNAFYYRIRAPSIREAIRVVFAPACQNVVSAISDKEVALRVTGQLIVTGSTFDVLNICDSRRPFGCAELKVDRDTRCVLGIVERVCTRPAIDHSAKACPRIEREAIIIAPT